MTVPALEFLPRNSPWDSLQILAGLTRADVALTDNELNDPVKLFEFDMYTEYDSENFCMYLERRRKGGTQFTPEFLAFERIWRRDERNHYIGYRRLYALCGGPSEEVSHERMLERHADFKPIEEYLEDEFMICMVLAYDEIVTSNSCRMDFPLFLSMGHPMFLRWIRSVARDEAFHFLNILDVIRLRHAHRLLEAPSVLQRLRSFDASQNPYLSTFVMDHDPDRFPPAILDTYCQKILLALRAPRSRVKTATT